MTTPKRATRKRPCPYCQKKLTAKTRRNWHVNLARHLANTCQPYQRQHLSLMLQTVWRLLDAFLPAGMTRPTLANTDGYVTALKARAEISELERLAKL